MEVGLIDYVCGIISKSNAKVYIATDSAVNGGVITYAITIALRYENKGAHVLYRKIKIPRDKIRDNYQRLFKETEFSLEVANFLRSSGVYIEKIELDYNQDETWFSHKLVNACEGWCKGLGYKTITKPDEMMASRAADKICNT